MELSLQILSTKVCCCLNSITQLSACKKYTLLLIHHSSKPQGDACNYVAFQVQDVSNCSVLMMTAFKYLNHKVKVLSYIYVPSCMFCLFRVFHFTREFFTNRETSEFSFLQPTCFSLWFHLIVLKSWQSSRRYMAETLPIRCKTLSNQSINKSQWTIIHHNLFVLVLCH